MDPMYRNPFFFICRAKWLMPAMLACCFVPAHATTINFDVSRFGDANYEGTAVVSNDGTTWNSFLFGREGSPDLLLRRVLDSQGNPIEGGIAALRAASDDIQGEVEAGAGNPSPLLLMQDYAQGDMLEVAVGGLESGDYLLYVFAHGTEATDTSTVTINAANGGMSGTTGSAGTDYRNLFAANAEGNAYLKFDDVPVGDDGILQFTVEGFINGFQLIHKEPIVIRTQPPANLSGYAEFGVSIPVLASGPESRTFQWQKSTDGGSSFVDIDTEVFPSAATDTLEFTSLRFTDSGMYRVVISSPLETLISEATALTVEEYLLPYFTAVPEGKDVSVNGSVTFDAEMLKVEGISFQWFKDGEPIEGATDSSYTIAEVDFSDAGNYTVEARNDFGTLMSEAAALFVFSDLPAFPGANGPAKYVSGGRGGIVYHVTRLDGLFADKEGTIEGTFWYGLNNANFPADTPRTIVFDVAGTIHLGYPDTEGWTSHGNAWDSQSRKGIGNSNITIAGGSAPGPVIFMGGTFKPQGQNIIIRNITIAAGYGVKNFWEPDREAPVPGSLPLSYTMDAMDISGQNIMIDHIAGLYGTDETIAINETADNISIQYSNISQSLNYEGHAYAHIMGTGTDKKVSVSYCLEAHHFSRLPRVGHNHGEGGFNDFRNNVFYDWGANDPGYGGNGQPSSTNFINNYYIEGPSGGSGIFDGGTVSNVVYAEGNLRDINHDGDPFDPSDADVAYVNAGVANIAFDVGIGLTLSAEDALPYVLNYAGPRWWERDYDYSVGNTEAIDTPTERIVHETITGTGEILDWADNPFNDDPNEGVEWRSLWGLRPQANGGVAPYSHPDDWDIDRDGMPGRWETKYGLNPHVADNNVDFDNDGYTALEEYLHEVAAWPAPSEIHFTGESDSRYAVIQNWLVTGVDVEIDGKGLVTTASNWQPSRYDTAVISGQTVVVDAPGQHAGTLRLSDNATLAVEKGWLELSSLEIGSGSTVEIAHPGTLRLAGSGEISLADGATFINSGTLDITNWEGTLPEGFVNNGTVLDEDSERWGAYYILKDDWVNTGRFLGWFHVGAAPWLYVYPLGQWVYCAEEWLIDGMGAWAFAPEMVLGSSTDADVWLGYPVGDDGWIESTPLGRIYPDGNHAFIEQLDTWVYFSALNSETPISWMFVFDRNG